MSEVTNYLEGVQPSDSSLSRQRLGAKPLVIDKRIDRNKKIENPKDRKKEKKIDRIFSEGGVDITLKTSFLDQTLNILD